MSTDAQVRSCPMCDATFACEMDSPQGCWCAKLEPLSSAAIGSLDGLGPSCLCERCLAERVAESAQHLQG